MKHTRKFHSSESVVVTGSSGFVGRSLASYLHEHGFEITGLARKPLDRPSEFSTVCTSYDPADLAEIIRSRKPEYLIHAAGSASVQASISDPLADMENSLNLFARVLEGVRRSNLRPLVVYISSAAVYGNPTEARVSERSAIAPISPYGYHRAACELLAAEYTKCWNIPSLVVRLFSVFGPLQRRLLVWEIFDQLAKQPRVELKGTGREERDFAHIDGIAASLSSLLPIAKKDGNLIVNLASGQSLSVFDLAMHMRDLIGIKKDIVTRGIEQVGQPTIWRADVSKLRQLTGVEVSWDFDKKLAECMKAWRQ